MLPLAQAARLQLGSHRVIQETVRLALAPFRLTTTAWRALRLLADQPEGRRLSELARELDVEPPLVSRLAATFSRSHLVEHEEDPDDRRAKRYRLTEQGLSVLTQASTAVHGSLSALFTGIPEGDLKGYFSVMERLTGLGDR